MRLWAILALIVVGLFAFRTGYVEGMHYGYRAAMQSHYKHMPRSYTCSN